MKMKEALKRYDDIVARGGGLPGMKVLSAKEIETVKTLARVGYPADAIVRKIVGRRSLALADILRAEIKEVVEDDSVNRA